MKWKSMKNYEGYYEISENGQIRSLKRTHETRGRFGLMQRKCGGIVLKAHVSTRGYMMLELNKDKEIKKILIHRAVYENFVGPLDAQLLVHHKDHDKINNHYKNLVQIDVTEHNNIHSKPAWNKGIKNPKEMIENARVSRLRNHLPKCKAVYDFRKEGKNNKQISLLLGICERQVIDRHKKYKEYLNGTGPYSNL